MSSGCQVLSRAVYRPVGFGLMSVHTEGSGAPGPWSGIAIPTSGPATPIYFPPANVAKVFTNFTNKTAAGPTVAWYAQSMVGYQDPGSVATLLNNFAIRFGGGLPDENIFIYTGPPGLNAVGQMNGAVNNPFPSLQALAWGVQHGYLKINQTAADRIQSDAVNSNIVPPSFWEYIGKPLLIIVLTVAGGSLLSTTGSAAGTGAASGGGVGGGAGAGSGGLAPTSLSSIPGQISGVVLNPVDTGLTAIPGSGLTTLTQTFSLMGAAGGGGGLLSGGSRALSLLGKVSNVANTGLKGAALLASLKAQSGGPQPMGGAPAGAASPGKSALPVLIIGGLGVALFALAHVL